MSYFLSTTLTFFLVMDALGTIPSYLTVLGHINSPKRMKIALREIGFSLIILFIYFYLGDLIIKALDVYHLAVEVAGGVVLFIIGGRFVFMPQDEDATQWQPGTHFIVPIATPIIASPSVFAVLMIYAEGPIPNNWVILSMVIAWFVSALIYLFAVPIQRVVKDQGLIAIQRFMGLIVSLIAVQKIIHGLTEIIGGR